MTTKIEKEEDIFAEDLQTLLTTIQKMTQNKVDPYTKGVLMDFFVNITVNLLINSGICHECFQAKLTLLMEAAEEQGLLTSHDDKSPGHLH